MMFVIFDLDGTLALNKHRQHFIDRPVGEKDWDSFHDACDKDVLNWQIAGVVHAMYRNGNSVSIWTGRPDTMYLRTCDWLRDNGLQMAAKHLKMRPKDDHSKDTDLKKRWLDEALYKPDLVFEDRASVVKMWRDNGINCVQVAEGNF